MALVAGFKSRLVIRIGTLEDRAPRIAFIVRRLDSFHCVTAAEFDPARVDIDEVNEALAFAGVRS